MNDSSNTSNQYSMDRRRFLRSLGISGLGLAGGSLLARTATSDVQTEADGDRNAPEINVLFLSTDQHHYQAIGPADHMVRTPFVDGLANDGVFFEESYCPAAVCSPTRASWLTGQYPSVHQMEGNDDSVNPELPILTDQLRRTGMQTAHVGKIHLRPMESHWGFDWMQRNTAMYNTYAPWANQSDYITWAARAMGMSKQELISKFEEDEESRETDRVRFLLGSGFLGEEHHYNTWTANQAIRYLWEGRNSDQPFFLNVGFFGPHHPMLAPNPWDKMYDPEEVELPAQFYADYSDKPYLPHSHDRMEWWDDDTWRQVLAAYYGQISQIDHHIGRILSILKQMGLYENTLIILTGDHGDHNGEFEMMFKGSMYEGSVRSPFIMRFPDIQGGKRVDRVVNNLGVYRTILERCGITVPRDVPSRNLYQVLEHPGDWDNATITLQGDRCMLRRDHMKLARHADEGKVFYEMYDLSDKPVEMVNVYDDPRYAGVQDRLQQELDGWYARQEEIRRSG